jgi:NAD(P)-dependent dehydrogenase (short-subunit alcohol dehydrogenase family)
MGSLDGKSIVITGSGRGLGRAYAIASAAEGARVVINDVDGEEADRVAAEISDQGGTVVASHHCASDPSAAEAMVQLCIDSFGRIDGLVNNAAYFVDGEPWEVTPEETKWLVDSNILGTLYCGIAAMKPMKEQGSGVIINVTSGAHLGMMRMSLYAATKGAVASLVYDWALELAPHNIRVCGFSPLGKTRMGRPDPSMEDTERPEPWEVAPAIAYLLSDLAAGLTGQILRADGKSLGLLSVPSFDEPKVQGTDLTVGSVAAAVNDHLRSVVRTVGITEEDLRHVTG